MTNILKEAIADAKAVKATALANAKAALEEAFEPRIKGMLSRKLQEEELEESEGYAQDDSTAPNLKEEDEVDPTSEIAPKDGESEGKDEGEDELDLDDETSEEGKPTVAVTGDVDVTVNGEPVEATAITDDAEVDIDGEPTEETPEGEEESSEEDLELESIIKELSEESDEEESIKESADEECKKVSSGKDSDYFQKEGDESTVSEDSEEENINLDELLKELEADTHDEVTEDAPIAQKPSSPDEITAIKEQVKSLRKENKEYHEAISYLRGKLNEVNLLNAKLLYTTKLFRSNALTNEQKIKVVESLDLTKNVREVKLVYAALAESFNFNVKPVKKTSSITEGLASKVVSSTKPTKTVLAEGYDMAARFQELAGIKVQK